VGAANDPATVGTAAPDSAHGGVSVFQLPAPNGSATTEEETAAEPTAPEPTAAEPTAADPTDDTGFVPAISDGTAKVVASVTAGVAGKALDADDGVAAEAAERRGEPNPSPASSSGRT